MILFRFLKLRHHILIVCFQFLMNKYPDLNQPEDKSTSKIAEKYKKREGRKRKAVSLLTKYNFLRGAKKNKTGSSGPALGLREK